jgi:hypothetical protein
MVKRSLTVSLHSSNPVPQIAYLIDTALHEHCDLSPEFHADYQLELSTVTGLSLTAILAEGSRIRSCKPHFATFLRYRDFTRHTDRLEQLSHAIAVIICSSIYPFKKLGFPFYYDSFLTALANTLKSPDDGSNAETMKGIKKIMQDLFEQCS